MDKLTRSIESKTRKMQGTRNLRPTNDKERQHRTTLVVFDAMMRFEAEVRNHRLTGQDKARLADEMATKVAAKVKGLWGS